MAAQANGKTPSPIQPTQLAFALPTSPDTKIHLSASNLAHCLFLTIATATVGSQAAPAALGSLVYALPDRLNHTAQPLSTALYTRTNTLDFMTRLAKILAKKLNKPIYVGGEVKFWDQDDEALAMRACVDVITASVE